jgi:hypothetical protein
LTRWRSTQDQVYIRALAVDFFISLVNTVEAWAQRTLDEIESWDDLSPDGKNERALEKLRELPAPTPGRSERRRYLPALSSRGTDARDKVLRTDCSCRPPRQSPAADIRVSMMPSRADAEAGLSNPATRLRRSIS